MPIDFYFKPKGLNGESKDMMNDAGSDDAPVYASDHGATASVPPDIVTLNFEKIKVTYDQDDTKLGEGGYGASASDDYHDDTSDLGNATFFAPVGDETASPPVKIPITVKHHITPPETADDLATGGASQQQITGRR